MAPISSITTSVRRLTHAVRRRADAVGERLLRIFVVRLFVRTVQEMSDDDGTHMAAGVAYYALFSLFPLLLGLIAILSWLLGSEDVETRFTDFVTDFFPGSEELIDSNIDSVAGLRGALAPVAIIGLFWSGSAIFGAVNRAVNRAWDVHVDRPFHISKPRQMVMALAVGFIFVVSLSTATFVRVAGRFGDTDVPGLEVLVGVGIRVALQGTAFVLTLSMFLLVYKFMPNTKTYWRYIWPGAVLGAVLFEVAKNLFILYLNRFANFQSLHGSLAPVIVFLTWAYVSSLILILGAELSSEYGRLRMGVDRGVLLHPRRPSSEGESGQPTDEER